MNIKEAFELYRSLGLKTLPINKDKSPYRVVTWKGGIDDWNSYIGSYGIGIICGNVSNNLECIDFDNHFGDAKETISQFLNNSIPELYKKYNFPIESTMNGGFHLVYRCDIIDGNLKLAQRAKKDGDKFRPDTIIETRGEGGYFVSAPTLDYKWVRNDIKSIPKISIDDRDILITACKEFNTWFEIKKEYQESMNQPGDIFNNSVDSESEAKKELINNGWKELKTGIWQRPNKNNGISATYGKVAENIFYVFSSNAYPFSENKAYTPFQIIGLLRYKGDFKTFAKDLAEKYNLSKPIKKDFNNKPVKVYDENQLEEIIKKVYINTAIPIERPPVVMKIRDFDGGVLYDRRLFTLGNFSAITGKSKSKKSFLAAIFLATAIRNTVLYNKLIGNLPESKDQVILFDTEQSNYDAYRYAKTVERVSGTSDRFVCFALREFSPKERCEIIDYTLTKFKDSIGYVVIDGIADLVNAINDEDEATRVITLLMKWTKIINCHITVNIHQNKNDNFATGWIGSYILKKAECIISVTKKEGMAMISEVECVDIRGTAEFKNFEIEITDEGLPIINDNINISKNYEIKETPF